MPQEKITTLQSGELEISGTGFVIPKLEEGKTAYSNRNYVWRFVPESLEGMTYTRLAGGVAASVRVKAAAAATLRMLSSGGLPTEKLAGWTKTGESVRYSDKGKTPLYLFTRPIAKDQVIELPQGDWMGSMLMLDSTGDSIPKN